MPKKSEFDHLKPQVFDLLRRGAKPSEVLDRYPGIPMGSIKTWAKKIRDESGSNVRSIRPGFKTEIQPGGETDGNEARSVVCEVVSDESDQDAGKKIVRLPSGSESDFSLVRKEMRAILRDKNAKPYAKAIAGNLLLKSVEMRANLPASVLEETPEATLEQERRDLRESKSAEDLAREYREMLKGAG